MNLHMRYLLSFLILIPIAANAHPGHEVAYGVISGFLHPLLGIDHLIALIGVGLWSVQNLERQSWSLPTVFVVTAMVGSVLAIAGISLPSIDAGIALSILVLGILVARAARLHPIIAGGLVVLFALIHGYAHGIEMPKGMDYKNYLIGFMGSSSLVISLAMYGSKWAMVNRHKSLFSLLGAMMCVYGFALLS